MRSPRQTYTRHDLLGRFVFGWVPVLMICAVRGWWLLLPLGLAKLTLWGFTLRRLRRHGQIVAG
jgi:hypothetical protein